MAEAEFEPARALESLNRHGVEYVLVGGLGARAHGATRPTSDIDLVPNRDDDNLGRLAAALLELNARLRVGGMTDDEARQLPVQLDAETLRSFGSSTWMTDAGPIDVLRDLRDRQGGDVAFDELISRGVDQQIGAVVVHVAALDDIIASKEHADREKDREALPELRNLNRER
ncbi:MAG TPA: hypothetical protein VES40_12825 [Ilumatobacteraceae bacterium]|jgi:predicted nucleotidyltransferase|nr:hypothetical protein [Ilumatobacteraceae bacterium]